MNANKKNNHFIIDFINQKIRGTKACFNKASKGISEYYDELTTLIADHPDYKLVITEPKHKADHSKRTYHGMDYSFMENYISIQKNAEQLNKEYEAVKTTAKNAGRSVYPLTKKWFLNKFSSEDNTFDMVEATEAISKALIDGAVSSVHPAD